MITFPRPWEFNFVQQTWEPFRHSCVERSRGEYETLLRRSAYPARVSWGLTPRLMSVSYHETTARSSRQSHEKKKVQWKSRVSTYTARNSQTFFMRRSWKSPSSMRRDRASKIVQITRLKSRFIVTGERGGRRTLGISRTTLLCPSLKPRNTSTGIIANNTGKYIVGSSPSLRWWLKIPALLDSDLRLQFKKFFDGEQLPERWESSSQHSGTLICIGLCGRKLGSRLRGRVSDQTTHNNVDITPSAPCQGVLRQNEEISGQ